MVNKILLADDDANMQDLLAGLLEAAGYAVVRADNGREAVEKARKELPSLVMMDIHMPKLDGIGALKELKADPLTKAIPVVMLTVDASISEIEFAMIYGAKTYVTKPSSREEILRVVKSII